MAVGMGSLSLGWSLLWEGGAQPFLSPSRAPLCLGGGAVLCHPPPPPIYFAASRRMLDAHRVVGWGGG